MNIDLHHIFTLHYFSEITVAVSGVKSNESPIQNTNWTGHLWTDIESIVQESRLSEYHADSQTSTTIHPVLFTWYHTYPPLCTGHMMWVSISELESTHTWYGIECNDYNYRVVKDQYVHHKYLHLHSVLMVGCIMSIEIYID